MARRTSKLAREIRPGSQRADLIKMAENHVVSAFKAAGWSVSHPRGELAPDLLCRQGNHSYAVEVRAAPGRGRRSILRALMADAILQSRAKAAAQQSRPLALLAVPSFSDAMVRELEEYSSRFGGDSAWGIVDGRGRFDLHGVGLEGVMQHRPVRESAPRPRRGLPSMQGVHDPFSDLGQWMLKVLLAPNVPERWLHAPRERPHGVADLAALALVSNASASKFLASLERGGHVVEVDGRLRVSRVAALLEDWKAASKRPIEEQGARLLLPSSDPERSLREALVKRRRIRAVHSGSDPGSNAGAAGSVRGERACLGLFSACKALGVSFVRGSPVHVYAEDLSSAFLAELGLVPVSHPAEADVMVRRPRFAESVFRGCVIVDDVPVADILQCWVDVSSHPARGAEQAADIAQRLHVEKWSA